MAHEQTHHIAHDHSHDGLDSRRLGMATVLTVGFMVAEVVGGLLSGSLALLADAAHMLTDAAALGMAWFAAWIARHPADGRRSYGYHRFQVLVAFVNGLALIVVTIWICVEAVKRVVDPVEVLPLPVMAVAALGLLVNAVVFAILHGGDRANLNIQGALLHVSSDLLGSVAAIAAAIVIYATGWTPIDPLLSVLVAGLILRSGWMLVHRSAHILLEGTPEAVDLAEISAAVQREIPEVNNVHHVHVWSLSQERPLLTLHARVSDDADRDRVLARVLTFLRERFAIEHATVQIEGERCAEKTVISDGPHEHRHV